jgi:hypothetical protein
MGLLIGLLVVNLAISCIVGWVSNQRGRSFWLGFWLSAFLSPLFGILVLIALPAREMRLQDPVAQDHVSASASELTALEGRSKRVQAIADDIVSGQRKYADIDAWELLEDVLELDLTGGDEIWTNQKVASRVSLARIIHHVCGVSICGVRGRFYHRLGRGLPLALRGARFGLAWG